MRCLAQRSTVASAASGLAATNVTARMRAAGGCRALRRGFAAVVAADGPWQWATTAGAWVGISTFLFAGLTQYSFGDAEVVISMWLATAVLMRCAEPA